MGKKFTFILSTAPYEKRTAFTGARIALTSQLEDHETTLALMEDGVYGAKTGQESVQFFRTVEILNDFLEFGGKILVCGMCLKERGIKTEELIPKCEIIDMSKLVQTMADSDQTVFF